MTETTTEVEAREFSFNDRDFRFLAELVNKCTGIVIADQKKGYGLFSIGASFAGAEIRQTSANTASTCREQEGADEIGNLVNAITTNLTHFFRENHHFEHLRDIVLPVPKLPIPPRPRRLSYLVGGLFIGNGAIFHCHDGERKYARTCFMGCAYPCDRY